MSITTDEIISYRHYLSRTDENAKAYKFINAAAKLTNDPEIKKDAELVFKQVAHLYDKGIYDKYYDLNNTENPFPEEAIFVDYAFPSRLAWVKKLLKEQKANSVLDIGCSDGAYSLNLAKDGFDVTGVNLAVNSIELAKERAKKFNLQVDFVQSDFMDYKPEKKFDAVMFFEVIEHVADPEVTIKKLLSFIKPGGVIYISTPDGTADEPASALGVDLENAAGFQFKGHVRVFDEKSIRELLKDYEIVDLQKVEERNIKLLHCAFKEKK
jgi:ubiquinone biosynthesis O-methyltransferase